jgi:hypothetical protein
MIQKLKKINEALPELIAGILAWGVLCELIGVWFVSDKLGCSLGLWIGIATAVCMAVHMAWSLDRVVTFEQKDATALMTKHNLIRYAAVVLVEVIIMLTKAANPLAAFLGIMGLKVAAYLQPFTHKLFRR